MVLKTQPSLIDQLRPALSDDRVGSYLKAAGFDPDRALALYLWNAQIGEAFHLPLQAVEVSLRNRISSAFAAVFGPDWWRDPDFRRIAGPERIDDIELVVRRLTDKHRVVNTGQIVSGLSFGFWVALLQARYNPKVWSAQLKLAFPHLPLGKARSDIAYAASRIAFLRNRISHHEPLIRLDLSAFYADAMALLEWVWPLKARWIRPHCRVPPLLRSKP
ncbi:MAG TPA: hypothetical protein VFP12_00470 [Allosphingosinicella sp.]|nr:hypothetical protein [Allosphingosinicella sp.]